MNVNGMDGIEKESMERLDEDEVIEMSDEEEVTEELDEEEDLDDKTVNTCPSGMKKKDILSEECDDCMYKERCNVGKKNTNIDKIKNDVREAITVTKDELIGYRGCAKIVRMVMDKYKASGVRRRKGYKERKEEIKAELKEIAKLPPVDEKLNLLIDCAEFVYFG